MIDVVAKALCEAAGRSIHHDPDQASVSCSCCDRLPDGRRICIYWDTFRGEAKAAILAAHAWHKRERRWPEFCKR